jgi:hypothetical protein
VYNAGGASEQRTENRGQRTEVDRGQRWTGALEWGHGIYRYIDG